jgi:hypothetical protein
MVNEVTHASRSGTCTVADAVQGTASSVTVNGSAATLYADQTFAQVGWAAPSTRERLMIEFQPLPTPFSHHVARGRPGSPFTEPARERAVVSLLNWRCTKLNSRLTKTQRTAMPRNNA